MTLSITEFLKATQDSGIISAEALTQILDGTEPTDGPDALAKKMVAAGCLTEFQAKQVSGGNVGSLTLGPYLILDLLGKGGMGCVYRAEHRVMRRQVAVKVISNTALVSPSAVVRFRREVQAAALLEHPNVVTAFDAGESDGTHYLVMQLVDGTNLSDLVKKEGVQPIEAVGGWILQAARGLAYAHGRGVVHRDIKPANLLLSRDGTIKILDMGLARLEFLEIDEEQLTGTGQIMGTVDFMAPEQALDTKKADARSDIYSLGATLWYLLAGRPMFSGSTVMSKMMGHIQTPAPALLGTLPDVPPRFEAAYQRMVAKNPGERFQTMLEVVAVFESFGLAKAAGAALPPFADQTAPSRRPRLLVDWGETPRIGQAARPLFFLVSPGTTGRPVVKITVDRDLDTDPADPLRQVRAEEEGLWSFSVPFSLTTGGLDPPPGTRVIALEVMLPQADDGRPRFLRTQIRLTVPDASSGRREPVIDGDGQSALALAGLDLRGFSRVILGRDAAGKSVEHASQQQLAVPEPSLAPVVFEYDLMVDRDIQSRLPSVVAVAEPTKADALTLASEARRIHLIARKRATFGRSRENDICLRFLPKSSDHDEASRAISRTHMSLDLSGNGLVLTDESTQGVDIDCEPLRGDTTFTHRDARASRHVDLPSPLAAKLVLRMDLTIFAQDPKDPEFQAAVGWDDLCFDMAGEPAARLWQLARECGIETARVRRLENLPEEEYVFLYRHATIGRSAKDHAIALPALAPASADLRLLYVGRMFWLHSGGRTPLAVDGRPIEGACLVPLAIGQSLAIGDATLEVSRFTQL